MRTKQKLRTKQTNEEIFFNRIQSLVKNLIVENKNNKNSYFCEQSKFEYRDDVIERGSYILKELENLKHLIVDEVE